MANVEKTIPDFEENDKGLSASSDQIEEGTVEESRSYGEGDEEFEEEPDQETTGYGYRNRRGQRSQRNKPQANTNIPPGQVHVPEVVKHFVTYLHKYIKDKNIHEIQNMYESGFHKITEKYFKQSPWPPAESIADL